MADIPQETRESLADKLRRQYLSDNPGGYIDIDPSGPGASFERLDDGTVRLSVIGVGSVTTEEAVGNPGAEALRDVRAETQGGASDLSLAEIRQLAREGTSVSVGDRFTLNLEGEGAVVFPSQAEASDFWDAVDLLPEGAAERLTPDALGDAPDLAERMADRRDRIDNREAARDAAESAGVDLDEFGIDARADGTVVVQDRDTGRTRTIDADAPGGVGSAIDAATGDGQFVADDADPAAGASGSGDGLGARAAGAIVLLFGALAAALGWLS
jgi:hypothetical protein